MCLFVLVALKDVRPIVFSGTWLDFRVLWLWSLNSGSHTSKSSASMQLLNDFVEKIEGGFMADNAWAFVLRANKAAFFTRSQTLYCNLRQRQALCSTFLQRADNKVMWKAAMLKKNRPKELLQWKLEQTCRPNSKMLLAQIDVDANQFANRTWSRCAKVWVKKRLQKSRRHVDCQGSAQEGAKNAATFWKTCCDFPVSILNLHYLRHAGI